MGKGNEGGKDQRAGTQNENDRRTKRGGAERGNEASSEASSEASKQASTCDRATLA